MISNGDKGKRLDLTCLPRLIHHHHSLNPSLPSYEHCRQCCLQSPVQFAEPLPRVVHIMGWICQSLLYRYSRHSRSSTQISVHWPGTDPKVHRFAERKGHRQPLLWAHQPQLTAPIVVGFVHEQSDCQRCRCRYGSLYWNLLRAVSIRIRR